MPPRCCCSFRNAALKLPLRCSVSTLIVTEASRLTDKGIAAIEGKSYVEYDEHEVFIPKGEVYTAHRTIMSIMSQARSEILVIDPYVDENLLDMFASNARNLVSGRHRKKKQSRRGAKSSTANKQVPHTTKQRTAA